MDIGPAATPWSTPLPPSQPSSPVHTVRTDPPGRNTAWTSVRPPPPGPPLSLPVSQSSPPHLDTLSVQIHQGVTRHGHRSGRHPLVHPPSQSSPPHLHTLSVQIHQGVTRHGHRSGRHPLVHPSPSQPSSPVHTVRTDPPGRNTAWTSARPPPPGPPLSLPPSPPHLYTLSVQIHQGVTRHGHRSGRHPLVHPPSQSSPPHLHTLSVQIHQGVTRHGHRSGRHPLVHPSPSLPALLTCTHCPYRSTRA